MDSRQRETVAPGRLVAAILQFLGGRDLLAGDDVREALEREVEAAGPDAVLALQTRLNSDLGWQYHPPDPLARRLHHLLAERFLQSGSRVVGGGHLAGVANVPVVIFSNHLSYADANVLDVLLTRAGGGPLAGRLTALAGPKVFSNRQRRFSSLCFGTVKVPQSADVSSGEAVMTTREVARAARQSIDAALERLRLGDALLLFGEGKRSRSGAMQRMLPAVARYLEVPGTSLLLVGLTGSESFFPVDQTTIHPAEIVGHVGRPVQAARLLALSHGDRRLVMDVVGLLIASLLPARYRGVYGDSQDFPDARQIVRVLDDYSE